MHASNNNCARCIPAACSMPVRSSSRGRCGQTAWSFRWSQFQAFVVLVANTALTGRSNGRAYGPPFSFALGPMPVMQTNCLGVLVKLATLLHANRRQCVGADAVARCSGCVSVLAVTCPCQSWSGCVHQCAAWLLFAHLSPFRPFSGCVRRCGHQTANRSLKRTQSAA